MGPDNQPTDQNTTPPSENLQKTQGDTTNENGSDVPGIDEITNIDEIIDTGGDDQVTSASAKKLRHIFHRLRQNLKKIDVDTLELLGLDPEPLRNIEEDLEDVFEVMRKHGGEVLSKAAAMESEVNNAAPTWEHEVGSFTQQDKSYTVRWDIETYRREHAEEGEVVTEPHYSCTCMSFIMENHDGEYCKHIDQVHNEWGSDGQMPEGAEEIGQYLPKAPDHIERSFDNSNNST